MVLGRRSGKDRPMRLQLLEDALLRPSKDVEACQRQRGECNMDSDLPAGTSTRRPLMRWRLRLLIALVLLVGHAFCYFIAPKIEVAWKSPGPSGCDLRLMSSVKNVSGIPTAGDSLIIVAVVDHVLHFRIFDGHGKVVADTDEKKLTDQARRIEDLRKQLELLWPPQKPTRDERVRVNAAVTSIVGYTWREPPRWVIVLTSCSYSFAWYAPRILLLWMGFRLLRRWYTAMKARPRRLQFGLRTVVGTVAVFAVTIALLNAWLLAPYQAERHAAAALRRLGGKIVMVDQAPRWLRSYVGKEIFNMDVATSVDLSHSQVTDSDLVHLLAFRHCRQVNLSDTEVSNAGLIYLRNMGGEKWLDLSRTRVTDVSVLFNVNQSWHLPSMFNLSGDRISLVEIQPKMWCPLRDLNLSDTDADDGTLAALPDGLVNLHNLDLCGTNVSDDGLSSLLRMEGLEKLNLMDTKVTPAGVNRSGDIAGRSRL